MFHIIPLHQYDICLLLLQIETPDVNHEWHIGRRDKGSVLWSRKPDCGALPGSQRCSVQDKRRNREDTMYSKYIKRTPCTVCKPMLFFFFFLFWNICYFFKFCKILTKQGSYEHHVHISEGVECKIYYKILPGVNLLSKTVPVALNCLNNQNKELSTFISSFISLFSLIFSHKWSYYFITYCHLTCYLSHHISHYLTLFLSFLYLIVIIFYLIFYLISKSYFISALSHILSHH